MSLMDRPQSLAFLLVVIALVTAPRLGAQSFPLTSADLADSASLARSMPRLAEQLLGAARDSNRVTALDDEFRLELVAGRFDSATKSLAELRALREARHINATAQDSAMNAQYELLAAARSTQAASGRPFPEAFAQASRERLATLSDKVDALVIRALGAIVPDVEGDLRTVIAAQKDRSTISPAEAMALLRDYQIVESYRAIAPLAAMVLDEDDRRRYIIERNIPVKTPDGATVCAATVRPRKAPPRLPALLEFTIYADSATNFREARRSASNGYVAVTGLTRGKGCSPDTPVPYEHDGEDAAALIDWISRQPWSDGRVGMYSGSYVGFTQWAAAKHMPKALKAMMPAVAVAPGIDVPMEGNVIWSFVYPWPFYTMNVKELDNATYNDNARWFRLNREWYVSGRRYRDLDKIDGTPNPIFDRWLDHPSYDAYWQHMIPSGDEFARIKIPVLSTAGYYYGGPGAAVYYFSQHQQHDPTANHYLVIGPYDHFRGQRGVIGALGDTTRVISGYELDPAARIDLVDLRYQWFDWIFKGARKPAMLKDRVNYQVTGANEWKHAPTLAAMANEKMRLHLSSQKVGESYRLGTEGPASDTAVTLTVNLADRTDVDRIFPGGAVRDTAVDASNGLEFISEPFATPTEISGLFSGHLDFITNKKDFDFNIQLYELTPRGEYMLLAPYQARASYVADLSHRHLLTPGNRERLDFRSVRLMSRRMAAGSRLVMVINVIKNIGQQINYGTGKDVSDETIADAGAPLTIRWFTSSYLDLPIWRP